MFDERYFEATTVLGGAADDPATLRFARMAGFDAVSTCFNFDLELHTADPDILAADLLGTAVTVRVGLEDDTPRYFNGIVDTFRFRGLSENWATYHLRLRPALWFLSKRADNRIFQEKTAVDVIEEVLGEHGDLLYELRLNAGYQKRDYCVQYDETDLDFVQRLMEHEGIYYFHEFDDGEHKLVLVDDIATLTPVPDQAEIEFEGDQIVNQDDPQVITRWDRTDSVVTGAYTHTDYDFTKPSADLSALEQAPLGHEKDDKEKYYYPGTYTAHSHGTDLVRVRLEEAQAGAYRIRAVSTARLPWSGARFALTQYPREAENMEYCILRIDYKIQGYGYTSVADAPDPGFEAVYELQPGDFAYRPPRVTPKSVMKGPQTAVVVGPSGEEIYTDEYSRVKVQFHWDRLGKDDENSSCWIRVSSVWAGSGWGFIQIPRIKEEVIVDFLEGDPDQPIITGRVYNAEQMPPYGLPDNKTQSGWKSNSSKGGGGWNELRFEDLAGSEEVYFQAQKDHNEWIKNNETRAVDNDFQETVGHDAKQDVVNDRDETVGNNKTTSVGVDRTVAIGSNDTETVGVDRSLSVGANETITVGANSDETIGINHSQTVQAMQSITVGVARTDTVGAAETRSVGANQTNTIGVNRTVNVGSAQSHSIGSDDSWTIGGNHNVTIAEQQVVEIAKGAGLTIGETKDETIGKIYGLQIGEDWNASVGKTLTFEVADAITLKCGSASIMLKKDGTIQIEGKDITLKGSGDIAAKASGKINMKGSKINQN
ncbi:MAG: type VI secretion system tip protein TssI/VgrG [Pseudomonadota bacterium]